MPGPRVNRSRDAARAQRRPGPSGPAGEQQLVQVASGGGAGDLDPAERLSDSLSRACVDVLGEDGGVRCVEPREKVVGDPGVVGAVLAIAAVWGSERERPVGGDLIRERSFGPTRCRTNSFAPAVEVFALLL